MSTAREEDSRAGGSGNNRLRVCLLLPKLQIGGAEVQVLHLLRNLDKSRFAVSLCCFNRGDMEMEKEARRHVESVFWIGFRWRTFVFAFGRLVRFLRRGRFDILHCHLALADSIGRLAGRVSGVPVLVTTEHGKHLWKSRPHLVLERLLGPITDLRICVSRDIMDIRRRREGTPLSKLEHIPNAVDPVMFGKPGKGRAAVMTEFGWGASDLLAVSVGRLVPAKNYPLLIETVSLLTGRFPELRCLLVGDGECRGEIAAKVESMGMEDHVTLAGSRRDIPDILAAADVFVLSSMREGLPVALLEAMAAGKAVVGTLVGGIPDAINNGENGILVPPGDAEALAAAAAGLLENAELRRELGRTAASDADSRFSARGISERIGEIYVRLYRKKKRPRV